MIIVNYDSHPMEYFMRKEDESDEGWEPCVALCPADVLELMNFLASNEMGKPYLEYACALLDVKNREESVYRQEQNPEFYRSAGWIPA